VNDLHLIAMRKGREAAFEPALADIAHGQTRPDQMSTRIWVLWPRNNWLIMRTYHT
jgi:hypothetical protein